MSTRTDSKTNPMTNLGSQVFADPVSYLASFGIHSELVEALVFPAAA